MSKKIRLCALCELCGEIKFHNDFSKDPGPEGPALVHTPVSGSTPWDYAPEGRAYSSERGVMWVITIASSVQVSGFRCQH